MKKLTNIGKELLNLSRSIILLTKESFADAFRLLRSPREGVKSLYEVSLYRNAIYLIINSGSGAILGFLFWIAVARLYSVDDVGLGSALISAAALLSFIGTLGLDFGIVRFLPTSSDKTHLLNSCFTISLFASVIAAFIFLAGLPLWSPKLMFARETPFFLAAFIALVAAASLSGLLSATFIGFRRASFTLSLGVITGLFKLLLVIALATAFKVFGIFASWGLGTAIALAVGIFLFLPQILHRYRPIPSFRGQATNEMFHFSFANYIGEALRSAPEWVLPLMILNLVSAEANAYFYISWAMTRLLLTIPMYTSLSFFAEGSHGEKRLGADLRRSLKLVALLLIPLVIIVLLFGDKLLLLFGRGYSEGGTHLLWLLALAALPAGFNFLYLGKVRVEKKLKEIILITGAMAFGVLLLSYLLLPCLDILGAGVGWLASQTIVAIVLLYRLKRGNT